MIILLTGAAGFIGFHAARKFLSQGHTVIGVDNLNDYYDPTLKSARLDILRGLPQFEFHKIDLAAPSCLDVFENRGVTHILHLAAQAGVRYSLENPRAYIASNVTGHLEVLEFARNCRTLEHLVYASSSSVYGVRDTQPHSDNQSFLETDTVRNPVSLYAATKLSAELLSESYANLYKIPQTGLRFFTVYGSWGRPDMAYFVFAEKILRGETITLYAPDKMERDFTHIGDITDVLPKILRTPPKNQDENVQENTHALYNLGRSNPCKLMDLVRAAEIACGKPAKLDIQPRQNGDVYRTCAGIDAAKIAFGFNPRTKLRDGMAEFSDWHSAYYNAS